MAAGALNDPGFRRMLRHALRTELDIRLRHTLLHGLKGPTQTILSALHLLQKKAGSGETENLDKYANWIKDAVSQLSERAEALLPPKIPEDAQAVSTADLNALTESAAHLLRDEAAIKEIELVIAPSSGECVVSGAAEDLLLALQAILLGVLDRCAESGTVEIGIEQTGPLVQWSVQAPGPNRPGEDVFAPRYDVQPPQSGIAWPVARTIVEEHSGQLAIHYITGGWRVQINLPHA